MNELITGALFKRMVLHGAAAITAQKLERLGRGDEAKAEDAQETGERAEEPAGAEKEKRRRHGGFALKRRDEGETEHAPEQETAAPETADAPETAQESAEAETAADSEPAAAQGPDAAQPEAAEAAEEPVCDGHCDTCTLECDAAERESRTDGAADGEADAQPEAEGENAVE